MLTSIRILIILLTIIWLLFVVVWIIFSIKRPSSRMETQELANDTDEGTDSPLLDFYIYYSTDNSNSSKSYSSGFLLDLECEVEKPSGYLRPARTTFVVIGILLNLFVIFASSFMIVTNKHSKPSGINSHRAERIRSYVHFYPMLFAVANIVFLSYQFLFDPFWSPYDIDRTSCHIQNSLAYILHSMLIYCIVALCCHVYSATRNRTLTVTPVIKHRYIILLIIILSILNGVPIMVWGDKMVSYNDGCFRLTVCYPWENETRFSYVFVIYFTTMVYFLPLLIIIILYSIVVYPLRRSLSSGRVIKRTNLSTAEKGAISKRKKLTYASIILAFSFFVSYFPTIIYIIVEFNFEAFWRMGVFREAAGVGHVLHTCVVAIVWCITTDYRRYFRKYLAMRDCYTGTPPAPDYHYFNMDVVN